MKVRLFKRAGTENWQMKYKLLSGRWSRRSTGTADYDEACEFRDGIVGMLELQEKFHREFSVIADEYIDYAIIIKELKPLTIRTQTNRIKIIKTYFTGKIISQIDAPTILDVLVEMIKSRNITKATANRYIALLSAIFEYAKLYKYVRDNPMREIKYFNELKGRSVTIPIFSKIEIRMLFDAASEDFRPVLKFAVYTGARLGEICGLKWEDISFKDSLITIQRSYDTTTKTGESRTIPMHKELSYELFDWWKKSSIIWEHVFPSTHPGHRGKMRTAGFKTAWRATIRRAGIKYRNFHTLRHTFATDYVNTPGNTESQLMEICGWKSQAMVQRYKQMSQRMDELTKAIGRMGY